MRSTIGKLKGLDFTPYLFGDQCGYYTDHEAQSHGWIPYNSYQKGVWQFRSRMYKPIMLMQIKESHYTAARRGKESCKTIVTSVAETRTRIKSNNRLTGIWSIESRPACYYSHSTTYIWHTILCTKGVTGDPNRLFGWKIQLHSNYHASKQGRTNVFPVLFATDQQELPFKRIHFYILYGRDPRLPTILAVSPVKTKTQMWLWQDISHQGLESDKNRHSKIQ